MVLISTIIGVMAALAFVLVIFWDIVSVVVVPFALIAVAAIVSFIFGHYELTSSKSRNVAVIIVSTLFLLLSVYFSLSFPASMADGEHFRSIVPFLNVSFR